MLPGEKPKNTKRTDKPYKKAIFDTYVLWKSLPSFLRQLPPEKVARIFDVDDFDLINLFLIQNQSEFARKYKIEHSTLSNWNKLIDRKSLLDEVVKKWAQNLTKDVLFALYRRAIKTGRASEVRLWFQIVHGWNGKGSLQENTQAAPVTVTIISRTKEQPL